MLDLSPLTERHPNLQADLAARAQKNPLGTHGRIVVFPCGMYAEKDMAHHARITLERFVRQLEWSLIIATSDESSTFPWAEFRKPDNCKLWVMTPRPELVYPKGTRFIGEGCPVLPPDSLKLRSIDVMFRGQSNHVRRRAAVNALRMLPDKWTTECHVTKGFSLGLPQDEYLLALTTAKIVICPSGARTQDSFRVFEALEAGCIPIVDGLRADGGGRGYWDMIEMGHLFPILEDWSSLRFHVQDILDDYENRRTSVMEAWGRYKQMKEQDLLVDVQALQKQVYASDTGDSW